MLVAVMIVSCSYNYPFCSDACFT